jgi:hypothetical protein
VHLSRNTTLERMHAARRARSVVPPQKTNLNPNTIMERRPGVWRMITEPRSLFTRLEWMDGGMVGPWRMNGVVCIVLFLFFVGTVLFRSWLTIEYGSCCSHADDQLVWTDSTSLGRLLFLSGLSRRVVHIAPALCEYNRCARSP